VPMVNTTCIRVTDMSEAGLRIRVDDSLRRDFIGTCKLQDTTAAQVLRAYMRSYVEQHGHDLQQTSLFGPLPKRRRARANSVGN
jgi:hypothetical protein